MCLELRSLLDATAICGLMTGGRGYLQLSIEGGLLDGKVISDVLIVDQETEGMLMR